MTLDDLIARVRAAPGTGIYAKIHAVLDSAFENPPEAVEILKVLGPWALLEYDRRTLKRSNLPERAVPGLPRSDPWEWRKSDVLKWAAWTGKTASTLRAANRMFEKVAAAYRTKAETYREVRGRLDARTREQFEKWVKLRRLGNGGRS